MSKELKYTYIFMLSRADKMYARDMLVMHQFTTRYRTKLWMR